MSSGQDRGRADLAVVPVLARLLLRAVLAPRDRPYALADLEEELQERVADEGAAAARRWYWRQAWRSVVPSLLHRAVPRRSSRQGRRPSRGHARSVMGTGMLDLTSDLRVAFRSHRRTPIATAVTVLSLGLGIGSVAVALALVRQFVFPPPIGYESPERLATLYTSRSDGDRYGLSSHGDFLDMRQSLDALEDLAAVAVQFVGLAPAPSGDDATAPVEPLLVEEVSANYFRLAGLSLSLGRGILESDASVTSPQSAGARVVVLGYDLWRRRFEADAGILGETVWLDGMAYTVVGVARDGILGRRVPLEVDAWIPLGRDALSKPGRYQERAQRSLLLLGRLRPGATLEQLQAQVPVVAARLASEHPQAWSDRDGRRRTLVALAERESRVNPRARRLLLAVGLFFVGAASLILLLAVSNSASLFLSRAAARAREIAIRRSLGATRGRLVRLWLVDGLLPGLAAGGVGLAALWACRRALARFSLPISVPVDLDLRIEPGVFVVVFTLALATSMLFALASALAASRTDLVVALKNGALAFERRTRLGRFSPRNLLVLAECAAAVVLLVGATLFVRSFASSTTALGLEPARIALATTYLDPPDADRLRDPESGYQRALLLVERLQAMPGVEAAAVARRVELTITDIDSRVEITAVDGLPRDDEAQTVVVRNSVGPGYFEMLRVPILAGRGIAPTDLYRAPRVAIVNETFAQRYWPDGEALGRRFTLREPPTTVGADTTPRSFEVVGVARNGKYVDFDEEPTPHVWLALAQDLPKQVVVLAKGSADAAAMLPLLREVVTVEPGQMQEVPPSSLEDQVAIQFLHLRLASQVLGWGGAFGLLLASLGIYGVVALAVEQRRRELAIRVAVGARRAQVLAAVLGESARLVAMGLVTGLFVAVLLANLVRSVLVSTSPLDPLSLLPGVLLLLAVGVAAGIGPARQALRRDPLAALREE